ncbi:MAG: class I SAM-dependent methyltransferase [Pseudomonadota bacterium]
MQLPIAPDSVNGFLSSEEGACLFRYALDRAPLGPCLEIGSYCGKSTLYLGTACKQVGGVLFAVDHHTGSEENQPGWPYHDESLWNPETQRLDTLPDFRRTLWRAGLDDSVIPVIGNSAQVARHWLTPLSLIFVDGGHTTEHAMNDYRGWTPKLMPGGLLAIHDVFPNPEDGGRPPFEIYELALASGLFESVEAVATLRVLRKVA